MNELGYDYILQNDAGALAKSPGERTEHDFQILAEAAVLYSQNIGDDTPELVDRLEKITNALTENLAHLEPMLTAYESLVQANIPHSRKMKLLRSLYYFSTGVSDKEDRAVILGFLAGKIQFGLGFSSLQTPVVDDLGKLSESSNEPSPALFKALCNVLECVKNENLDIQLPMMKGVIKNAPALRADAPQDLLTSAAKAFETIAATAKNGLPGHEELQEMRYAASDALDKIAGALENHTVRFEARRAAAQFGRPERKKQFSDNFFDDVEASGLTLKEKRGIYSESARKASSDRIFSKDIEARLGVRENARPGRDIGKGPRAAQDAFKSPASP